MASGGVIGGEASLICFPAACRVEQAYAWQNCPLSVARDRTYLAPVARWPIPGCQYLEDLICPRAGARPAPASYAASAKLSGELRDECLPPHTGFGAATGYLNGVPREKGRKMSIFTGQHLVARMAMAVATSRATTTACSQFNLVSSTPCCPKTDSLAGAVAALGPLHGRRSR